LAEIFGGPVTFTLEFIKPKSVMAFAVVGYTIDAFIIFFAVGEVFMLETSILTGALNTRWLCLLLDFSFWAS